MERLSNKVANKVAIELKLEKDNREVIAYGAFAILQILFSIALVVIFGYLFNVVGEALMICFTVSILRKYSGGVHASSPSICLIIGTIICIVSSKIVFILSMLMDFKFILILGIVTYSMAYLIIYKTAPVDSSAKPIRKFEKRKKMKKCSMLILSAYLIITAVNIALYACLGYNKLLTYILCMYIGILWQVFTLTYLGHIVLEKLDAFLNIFFSGREK